MITILVFTAILAASYVSVGIFRRWSSKNRLLDIPNERSSHDTPVPRGAGVVIVIVSLAAYGLISYFYPAFFSWGYLAGALLVASISALDDVYTISFTWRLVIHGIAALLMILDLGYWNQIYLSAYYGHLEIGTTGAVLTFLWIVWLVNAYNFMDGIDGIAGIQAIVAGIGWLIVSYYFLADGNYFFAAVIVAVCIGFLIHNWSPARIFMGDVGSAFLGFTFAGIPLLVRHESQNRTIFLPVMGVLFVWFFVFDTLLTLIRRLVRGEKVWQAHREHIYQQLVIAGTTHRAAAMLYGFLTIVIVILALLAFKYRGTAELLLLFTTVLFSGALLILTRLQRNTLSSQ